ncbi:hypothetical protein G7Y31_05175 [Corynebacterium lizhenjunii]|uniref:Serine/threonine protein kinase n=1 Tax=Corynebacterium lizhenjunii TaxID=2709394 RepID=A0A7T0KH54_9CORY|nr:hypothetical protein [Corynebacterium lizhenjunii]QPK80079.1 hypothetical protein G7Y31_05175 [Corynebacterium lizhenjunii]
MTISRACAALALTCLAASASACGSPTQLADAPSTPTPPSSSPTSPTLASSAATRPAPHPVRGTTVGSEGASASSRMAVTTVTTTATVAPAPEPQPPAVSLHESIISQISAHPQAGATIMIGDEATTSCLVGNGYGITLAAANQNTSCEFAIAVTAQLTSGVNPTQENVRQTLPRTITASSPVTGGEYSMACTVDANQLITCAGGNQARVYLY